MPRYERCCFPGCIAELKAGFIACSWHYQRLNTEQQAKVRELLIQNRDRNAARVYVLDQFERMKGEKP